MWNKNGQAKTTRQEEVTQKLQKPAKLKKRKEKDWNLSKKQGSEVRGVCESRRRWLRAAKEMMQLLMEGVAKEVRATTKRIDSIKGECGAQRWNSAVEGETHRELEKI
jgi:hypothetical protein